MQLKEQLAVQAVVVRIEEFECDVLVCHNGKRAEGLAQVKVGTERRRQRKKRQSCRNHTASTFLSFKQKKHLKWTGGGRVEEGLAANAQVLAGTV